MKILIFSWRDIKHPKAGGSEQYFHEISKRWVKKGNKVVFVVGGWKNCRKEEIIEGVLIKRVGGELSLYLLALLEYFKLKRVDFVIDVDNGLSFCTPLFVKKPRVLHMHHIHKEVWFKEAKGNTIKNKIIAAIGYFVEEAIYPILYRNEKIITLSKSSAEEIREEGIGNVIGIVNPAITISRKARVKRTSFPSILFLNRIKKYKGIDVLIKAFSSIKDKSARLYLAGTGDYSEEAKKLSKDSRISFLGRVSDEEKYKLMEKSWIFVNPSFKEGWGIVNIEAAYFGLPVIGSRVSGIKDSIIEGKTGLLFKYGNAEELAEKILLLIKNGKLRAKIGKEAEKWAKNFSWDKSADKYLDILRKVKEDEI